MVEIAHRKIFKVYFPCLLVSELNLKACRYKSLLGSGTNQNWFTHRFRRLRLVFHSMLVAYAIFVRTLYGNRRSRLHGFWQHCMVGWRFYFFRYCLTKRLTGCWLLGSMVELPITLYLFDVKDLIYTYVKSVTRYCSNYIPWIAWIFSYEMLLEASRATLHMTKIA